MWRAVKELVGIAGHGRVLELRATAGSEVGSARATVTGVGSIVIVVWSQKKSWDAPESSMKERETSAVGTPELCSPDHQVPTAAEDPTAGTAFAPIAALAGVAVLASADVSAATSVPAMGAAVETAVATPPHLPQGQYLLL
ncbi:unnamed protein product [Closterium sp. NIES-54]